MRKATSASGDGGGVAVPARRVKAVPRVTRANSLAMRLTRSRLPALLPMKAHPTKTSLRTSLAWFAPIRRPAASGDPAVADVVADAAGAGAPENGRAGPPGANPRPHTVP